MEEVSLDDIEDVHESELSQSRLDDLRNGFSSFDDVLRGGSDPITLDESSGVPYGIIDGRHRVYLAREMGYTSVPAQLD